MKTRPAARERRRVVKNRTSVDATRISLRCEEVHAAAARGEGRVA